MNPADLEKQVKSGDLKPVYLLHGGEILLKDRMLRLLQNVVPEGMRDFNFQSILADEVAVSEVMENAQTMPFMTPPRLIILRGVDRYSADDLSLFMEYLKEPNESTCLVLVADKADFRLKFFKMIREKKMDVSFQNPKGKDLIDWVISAMRHRGPDMGPDAARTLIERVGDDLTDLDAEIEKIYLYSIDRKKVTVQDVEIASRLSATSNVFKLGDAIGDQQPGAALSALKEILEKDHHLPVLVMMIRHFRLLFKARLLIDRRGREAEAASVLGIPPFAARKYMEQARALGLAEIKKGLAILQETNLTLVTTQAPEHLVMDRMVLKLSTLKPRRRPGL